jgi:hypothetical protein
MYELNIDPNSGLEISNTIKRIVDGKIIKFDITLPEYAEYLQWSAEQNPMPTWTVETATLSPMIFPDNYNPSNR